MTPDFRPFIAMAGTLLGRDAGALVFENAYLRLNPRMGDHEPPRRLSRWSVAGDPREDTEVDAEVDRLERTWEIGTSGFAAARAHGSYADVLPTKPAHAMTADLLLSAGEAARALRMNETACRAWLTARGLGIDRPGSRYPVFRWGDILSALRRPESRSTRDMPREEL